MPRTGSPSARAAAGRSAATSAARKTGSKGMLGLIAVTSIAGSTLVLRPSRPIGSLPSGRSGVEAELVQAVATAPESDTEHVCTAGSQQVPDRIAHDVAVFRLDAESRLAGEKEIGFGLGPGDAAAVDHDGVVADSERVEREIDLGPAARRCDPMHDVPRAKMLEQLPGPRQRAPFGEQLAKDRAVAELDPLDLIGR